MPLTNAGRNFFAQAIINDSPTFFNNDNAAIGVGNSGANGDPGDVAGQTDLLGAQKVRKGMEDTFPNRENNVIDFKSEFGADDGNFNWLEWGVFNNAPTGGTMLNRKSEDLGTKVQGSTWIITVTLTINIGVAP